jgi:hypothetical protein
MDRKRGVKYRSGLVKYRGTAKSPIYVDTAHSVWRVPSRALEKNWPGLLNQCRLDGNRVLRPVGQNILTHTRLGDSFWSSMAWESALESLAARERGFQIPYTILNELYNRGSIQSLQGDTWGLAATLDETMEIFCRMGSIFGTSGGHGVGRGLENDIFDIALRFAPLAVEVDISIMYELIYAMDTMTGGDDDVMIRLISALDGPARNELLFLADNLVKENLWTLAIRIGLNIRGIDGNDPSALQVYLAYQFNIFI